MKWQVFRVKSSEIDVGALCTDVIRQVIAGDRALLDMSLANAAARPLPASIFVSPRIAFSLRIDQTWDRRRGFLPNIFDSRTASRDAVANVRVRFTIRPSPEPVGGGDGDGALTLLVPSFVTYRDEDRLEVMLDEERRVVARFTSDDRIVLRDSGGRSIAVSERWPVEPLAGILERTALWLRQGAPGVSRAFDPARDTELGKLLRRIAAYQGEIRKALETSIRSSDSASSDRHSDLDAFYVIDDFKAKALLKLDDEGRIAVGENGGRWQQKLDFEVRPSKAGALEGFVISIRPPDFLVDGPYHQKFIAALREARGELKSALDELRPSTAGFDRYLASRGFDESTLFVRIDTEDHDLVLMGGVLDGRSVEVLLLVRFDASELPDGNPRVDEAELIAYRERSTSWLPERVSRGQQKRIGPYMHRFLRTARSWGMVVRRESGG